MPTKSMASDGAKVKFGGWGMQLTPKRVRGKMKLTAGQPLITSQPQNCFEENRAPVKRTPASEKGYTEIHTPPSAPPGKVGIRAVKYRGAERGQEGVPGLLDDRGPGWRDLCPDGI